MRVSEQTAVTQGLKACIMRFLLSLPQERSSSRSWFVPKVELCAQNVANVFDKEVDANTVNIESILGFSSLIYQEDGL